LCRYEDAERPVRGWKGISTGSNYSNRKLTFPDFDMLAMNGGSYFRQTFAISGRADARISAISAPVKFPDEK